MGKRLSDIKEYVESSKLSFYDYLMRTEDELVMKLISRISEKTRVFIFSGVIRNFFLGEKNNRDIDIILENEIDIFSLLGNAKVTKNSFGGFKIIFNKTTIDLWFLEQTWAFKNEPMLNFDLERRVPGTAFFNFSAIVYSFNDKLFYYTDSFLKFLRDEKIDVVYEKNPNYKLCVVNTLYYSDKYNLNIKDKLKKYVIDKYNKHDKDYSEVQIKHFGKVIYPNDLIEHRIETINSYKKRQKKKLAIVHSK
ncbi:hypothetical protein [Ferruginibacter sp.]